MKGRRRTSDNTTPSLFPFLAVLLCTMGSLVLILMLIVSAAQQSSSSAIEQARLEQEELAAQLELAGRSYRRQLEQRRLELERKRLELEHLEQHIAELSDELQGIESAMRAVTDPHPERSEELQRTISELERQLAEADQQLKQQVPKPNGDKPIYAIIPYQGRNGTHRRPIYLECTEDGVTIQPEGIRLTLEDLQPPYGPGNPLDAALRLIRSEFRPSRGALTETAYPLLIVRPSGIRTYALARAAMSGWDDQFGYELVAAELDLAFPPSKPGLAEKLVQTIAVARQRQMALAMAMPGKYRRGVGGIGSGSAGSGSFGGPSPAGSPFGPPPGTDAPVASGIGNGAPAPGSGTESLFGNSNRPPRGDDFGDGRQDGDPRPRPGSPRLAAGAPGSSPAALSMGGGFPYDGPLPTDPTAEGSDPGDAAGDSDASAAGNGRSGGGAASDSGQRFESNADTGANRPGGPSGRYAPPSGGGYPGGSSPGTGPGAAAASMIPRPSDPTSPPAPPNGAPPSLGAGFDRGSARGAAQAGSNTTGTGSARDWTWKQIPPGHTAVVRPIRIHCFADRWIVIPDDGNLSQAVTIAADQPIHDRGMQTAAAVDRMVRRWGMAVAGGYWKPVLEVDVAPGAEHQFQLLESLMRSAGLQVTARAPTTGPTTGHPADRPTDTAQPKSRRVR